MDEQKEIQNAAPPAFVVWTASIGPKTLTLEPLEWLGVLLAIDAAAVPSFLRKELPGVAGKLTAGMDPTSAAGVERVRAHGRCYAMSRFYGRSPN